MVSINVRNRKMLEDRRYTVEEVESVDNIEIERIKDIMHTKYEEEFYFDDYITCCHCPFEKVCSECELYFGCKVWEMSLKDDL